MARKFDKEIARMKRIEGQARGIARMMEEERYCIDILQQMSAMEAALNRTAGAYSRYGSSTHKQVYIYGSLDTRPTELARNYGLAWGLGGWLLTPFLGKLGAEGVPRLRQRVVDELKTTFASHYTAEISLAEALQPEVIAAYNKKGTGAKYLINPSKGL